MALGGSVSHDLQMSIRIGRDIEEVRKTTISSEIKDAYAMGLNIEGNQCLIKPSISKHCPDTLYTLCHLIF